MTDEEILKAEEMLSGQTTVNESNVEELNTGGSVENVVYNSDEITE